MWLLPSRRLFPPAPVRVLLIEDDKLVSDFIRKIFSRFAPEMRMASYTDPREGLDRAKTEEFDAVVTDLMMPMITGLDIMPELHKAGQSCR